jgi:hypothetical protein
MSRFDDDLRRATAPLAREPLPPDILDEALDAQPSRPRWPALTALVTASLLLAVAVGIGLGQLVPEPTGSPVPSPEPTGEPSPAPVGACEPLAPPAGGEDVVLVYFPCGEPEPGDPASSTRSIARDTPITGRIETAVRAVLGGPTELEAEYGRQAVAPDGSSGLLTRVELADDGLATVDFDSSLRELSNLSASAAAGAFLGSLRETILQFDEVTALELTMDGSCDDFFEHFQAACQHFAKPIEPLADCPIIPPAELPSGAPITEPRAYPGQPMISWGSGADTVTQRPGHRSSGGAPTDPNASVRGHPASVRPTGDEPLPEPFELAWAEGDCPYVVFVAFEGGLDAAIDYAERYGASTAQPTPPPAEPITASVEELGIRLTVTLDRDTTVFETRVYATAEITNVGQGSVFWGHSGTCAWPASIHARPDGPLDLPYGRDDWAGDAGVLKDVTLYEVVDAAEPTFGFSIEEWLDSEGMFGCTTDLRISELPAGETLTHRVAWDTIGFYGMPPASGAYTVEGVFNFMSRGSSPANTEDIDEFSVRLTLPLLVDGPPAEWLSPGQAFDALLEDQAYRSELDRIPRTDWMQSDISFQGDRWVTALFSGRSEAGDQIRALVGSVDARSGAVIDVRIEEREPPSGG